MTKLRNFAAGLALLGFTAGANAAPIVGSIGFGSSTDGGVTNTQWAFIGACTDTTDCSGFNLTPDSNNAAVSFASGDLAGLIGLTATLSDVDVGALPISPQWSVGGYTFELLTASFAAVVNTSSFRLLAMTGTGTISDGVNSTSGIWDWSGSSSATGGQIAFSFNSNTVSVPEPTTLSLLALGLLGAGGAVRRSRKA